MLSRTLLPSKVHFCRLFSSSAPHVLKPGDILRQTRIFTNKDVLEYSKVSHDLNPLHLMLSLLEVLDLKVNLYMGCLLLLSFLVSFHHILLVVHWLSFSNLISVQEFISFLYKRSDFWEVQATNLRENNGRYLAKFKTRCFKRGELLVLEGEAVAILPTQAVEQANSAE
ncbi:(R)-specific enoyl-CoA hydratase [Quillaja saponaria]|uniref:(R)-specific enoyl-CoA hydratase n=1 Tax=Quillaja saponaria TaxID=32244 RepID=A0AAD7PMA7_QUISA|nr:(R)-specific enoyl-CoA hydratase [Quillaja saponaria]